LTNVKHKPSHRKKDALTSRKSTMRNKKKKLTKKEILKKSRKAKRSLRMYFWMRIEFVKE
jgi:hypothetical protein